ncbi:hypothetical protein SAMN04515674_10931 [Pseudarcicella hirudinis]|uniref:Uncharacterized protein n=1 Tax=Pseudarcicella hirudinis TaxID=1079859 RepID=A0A1I5VBZ0_9BACT|nr:hypothetical protein [Pseudarcicella hirudinis]SFQ05005.1 hypothetical protein SAMN04515674_10931 [Pseudarcicella hirudinis]
MFKRKLLETLLEGTGVILPPALSFKEQVFEILEINSERKFQRVFLLFHLLSIILLTGSILWKIYSKALA